MRLPTKIDWLLGYTQRAQMVSRAAIVSGRNLRLLWRFSASGSVDPSLKTKNKSNVINSKDFFKKTLHDW